MSVAFQRDAIAEKNLSSPAATPQLRFARRKIEAGAWRRFVALAKRAYGPLLIYAFLFVALIAAMTIKIVAWLPVYWR